MVDLPHPQLSSVHRHLPPSSSPLLHSSAPAISALLAGPSGGGGQWSRWGVGGSGGRDGEEGTALWEGRKRKKVGPAPQPTPVLTHIHHPPHPTPHPPHSSTSGTCPTLHTLALPPLLMSASSPFAAQPGGVLLLSLLSPSPSSSSSPNPSWLQRQRAAAVMATQPHGRGGAALSRCQQQQSTPIPLVDLTQADEDGEEVVDSPLPGAVEGGRQSTLGFASTAAPALSSPVDTPHPYPNAAAESQRVHRGQTKSSAAAGASLSLPLPPSAAPCTSPSSSSELRSLSLLLDPAHSYRREQLRRYERRRDIEWSGAASRGDRRQQDTYAAFTPQHRSIARTRMASARDEEAWGPARPSLPPPSDCAAAAASVCGAAV